MADRHNRDLDRAPAPLPEPLPSKCVDTHAHLEIVTNTQPDDEAIGKILAEAASVGIDRIVQVESKRKDGIINFPPSLRTYPVLFSLFLRAIGLGGER